MGIAAYYTLRLAAQRSTLLVHLRCIEFCLNKFWCARWKGQNCYEAQLPCMTDVLESLRVDPLTIVIQKRKA